MYWIWEMDSTVIADFVLVAFGIRVFNFLVWARRPTILSNFIVILLNEYMMQTSVQ